MPKLAHESGMLYNHGILTSLDWTTQPRPDLIFWKHSEIWVRLMPRLQSSTRIVLKPSSWAWNAVEAEKKIKCYHCSTNQPSNITYTDISGDATNINIGAALVSYQLL